MKKTSSNNQNGSESSGIDNDNNRDHNENIPQNNEFENDSVRITPWEVVGHVDYDRLIKEFGTQPIDSEIIEKFQKITGEVHPMLKLHYFFSHRDLDSILRKVESGEKIYLYTGRGPSGMVHMGHLMPWMFTKYLQDKFGSKLLFQLTDDEKFLYSQERTREEIRRYTYENILDIISVGFDPNNTKIIVDTTHIKHLYPIALEIAKRITFSTAKAVFGFSSSTNIGMIGFPPVQAAPCFLPSLIEGKPTPVLIPAAIDQDPYWRMTRDVAEKMGFYKPAQIHSKFLPSLDSRGGKMSSSKPETAIFTTDEPEVIEKKVSSAFTGGQATVALQRLYGGNALGCPVFWYLRYFFDDEKESDERFVKCISGNLLCGECKSDLARESKSFISTLKKRRESAKDSIEKYMYENEPYEI
ncbi:MAG: tryptophan--tRNA ligase [Nitrososphaeraceae archaeon]|jgi:tryptophanyl-tRNA synthetase|nr:tryptophan--tRNA ligase [Nitrososphaeraceae archaeon]MDW0332894.1 tryptophan--tRNA ligase [Nitrososphaeraceae archaeon]